MKIGVALSSGGTKGFAHIGVLKVLEKANIPIDIISGCSAGSIVAAFYAVYGTVEKLEDKILSMSKREMTQLIDITFPINGFLEGKRIYEKLKEYLKGRTFRQTKIPLRIVATDMVNGKEIVFKSGKIAPAVRASIGVPGIFKKFKYKGMILADGGILDPLPTGILKKEGADLIIGSNLNSIFKDKSVANGNIIKDINRAIELMEYELTKEKLKNNEDTIIIECNKKGELENYKYENIEKFIKTGEKYAKKMLPEIKRKIKEIS